MAHLLISHSNVAPLKSASENQSPVNFSDWEMTAFFCLFILFYVYCNIFESVLVTAGEHFAGLWSQCSIK